MITFSLADQINYDVIAVSNWIVDAQRAQRQCVQELRATDCL